MCDHNHCIECGDSITDTDEGAPRCLEHQTHTRCSDHVVYCRECRRVLAEVEQDRADDRAYDVAREAGR